MGRRCWLNPQNKLRRDGARPVSPAKETRQAGLYGKFHSLYRNPATSEAMIAPPHISSIHPRGNMRGTGDQVAWAKLPGTAAQNPTIIPILAAVFGPAPAVARLNA